MNRREIISILPLTTIGSAMGEDSSTAPGITTNVYPWMTFARREGEEFQAHSEELLATIAATGITGYEPIIEGVGDFNGLGDRLQKHGLKMKSLYVNSTLHEADAIKKSLAEVVAIAREAKKIGTEIIVTNPSPIKWGGDEVKSDAELKLQAKALDELGAALLQEGVILAYHNHDAELKNGAREFHHMLSATSPDKVKFCLDSHWIFRGCGDSQVALFDSIERYADRVVELHLRQSTGGIWNEIFEPRGDIDYPRLFEFLAKKKINPHLVLEQAVEDKSPKKHTAASAHQASYRELIKS